ncbi:hypothetical protein Tco_0842643 [Tanacetum coccineum]|uniref:Uncharacterized protein n=1 Tax=Tanacetum coccineum TaxID=301880 RepID=A0ABQ5AZU4_9ASTR
MKVFRRMNPGPLPPVVNHRNPTQKISTTSRGYRKGKEKVNEVHVLPQNRTLLVIVETSSLYAELGLTVSETDFDEEVSPETNVEAQEEGQGGTNPGNVVVSQTPSSHVVHAGPNLDHMDLGIAEASSHGANLTPSKG